MTKESRIDAGAWMYSHELFRAMFDGLKRHQPVTRCVWPVGAAGEADVEFEVRITRIGDTRIPARLLPVKPAPTTRPKTRLTTKE